MLPRSFMSSSFRSYNGLSFPDSYDFYVPYVLAGKGQFIFVDHPPSTTLTGLQEPMFRPEDVEQFEIRLLQSMEDTAGDNTFLKQAKAMMAERFQVRGFRGSVCFTEPPAAREVVHGVAGFLRGKSAGEARFSGTQRIVSFTPSLTVAITLGSDFQHCRQVDGFGLG